MSRPQSRDTYDVAVVGSGPAGASAALWLARHGARLLVLEKATLPRYKTCGGGLVLRARRLLPPDLRGVVERECYAVELHLAGADLHFSTRRSESVISMTMRDRLDFSLVSAAAAAGAEVQSSSEVLDVAAQAESVELVTTRGPRRARFVVAADGALSVVARRAGWPGHGALGPALEFEVFVHDEVHRRFRETARFDLGVVPGGYGWVFPKKDHLSIGLGILRAPRGPVNLNRMFDRYLRFLGVDTIIRQERHGFVIPLRPRPGPYLRRRVLLTGDAAGFAEPVTGEGLTFALQSGQLAARAVLEGDFDEGRVREAYDAELRRSILPELRWGRVLAKLTYGYPRLHAWLCRRHGTEFSEALTDVFVGETTYREFLRNPRNYLRLFLDGAAR